MDKKTTRVPQHSNGMINNSMLTLENQESSKEHTVENKSSSIHYNNITHFFDLAIKPKLKAKEIYSHPSHQFKTRNQNQLDGGCPWHRSKSKTAFTVETDSMQWYCRGCGIGGGPLQYLWKLKCGEGISPQGIDEIEIVQMLADKVGVTIPEYLVSLEQIKLIRSVLARQAILYDVIEYAQQELWSEHGKDALQYLKEDRLLPEKADRGRGLEEEEIKKLNIGFYPSINKMKKYLISRGHQPGDIKQSGVTWPKLEGYILIPWYDEQGIPLTIYGRWSSELPPEGLPKTIALPNPKDETGQVWEHTKRSPLYLDLAIKAGHMTTVLVEGVFDALLLQARGETRVIACVAAQLSGDQVKTLKKTGIKEVIICLDPDSAGEKGVMSCIKSLSIAGIKSMVAPKLPEGLDPDEYCIKYGIEGWYAHINQAISGFQHAAQYMVAEHGEDIQALSESALNFAYQIPTCFYKSLQDHFWPIIEAATGQSHESFMERIQIARDTLRQKKEARKRAEISRKREQLLNEGHNAMAAVLKAEDPRNAIKEVLKDSKILESVGLIHGASPEKIDAWEMDLKDAGVLVKDIERVSRAVKSAAKKQPGEIIQMRRTTEQQNLQTAGSMIPGCPAPEIIIPYPYKLDANKIILLNNDESSSSVIAHAPILIIGLLENIDDGMQYLYLIYKSENVWKKTILDRGIALEGRKLIDEASRGFPVAGDNKTKVAKYIHYLEAANQAQLPKAKITHHLGWQGKKGRDGFLWGHKLLTASGETVTESIENLPVENWQRDMLSFKGKDVGDEQIAKGYRSRGSFDDWQKTIEYLEPFPKTHIALYASLVPPMLHILEAPNFTVDFANKTSTGKTTTLRAAASIWGEPDEKEGGIMGSWDTTNVYIERACAVQSSLPVILDDTKRAKYKDIIPQTIYAIAQGQGRGRGNIISIAKTEIFRTVLLSSGEAPATSYSQDGGTRTRCLEMRGMLFGDETQETRNIVTQLNINLMKNYGHAGQIFIRFLIDHQDVWGEFKNTYADRVEHYANIAGRTEGGRLAQYFAAIEFAGTIAHAAGIFPWEWDEDRFLEVWKEVVYEASDAAGDERALKDVVSWAHSNQYTFTNDLKYVENIFRKQSGRWEKDEESGYIAFYPTILKQILTDFGYSSEMILSSWRDNGWLDVPEGEKRYTKKIVICLTNDQNSQARMIVIKNTAIADIVG